eukprot:363910-Chlamydomonas_euryale.AAC.16
MGHTCEWATRAHTKAQTQCAWAGMYEVLRRRWRKEQSEKATGNALHQRTCVRVRRLLQVP